MRATISAPKRRRTHRGNHSPAVRPTLNRGIRAEKVLLRGAGAGAGTGTGAGIRFTPNTILWNFLTWPLHAPTLPPAKGVSDG